MWSHKTEQHTRTPLRRTSTVISSIAEDDNYSQQVFAWNDRHIKKEELEPVGEVSTVCSQLVLKILALGTKW